MPPVNANSEYGPGADAATLTEIKDEMCKAADSVSEVEVDECKGHVHAPVSSVGADDFTGAVTFFSQQYPALEVASFSLCVAMMTSSVWFLAIDKSLDPSFPASRRRALLTALRPVEHYASSTGSILDGVGILPPFHWFPSNHSYIWFNPPGSRKYLFLSQVTSLPAFVVESSHLD